MNEQSASHLVDDLHATAQETAEIASDIPAVEPALASASDDFEQYVDVEAQRMEDACQQRKRALSVITAFAQIPFSHLLSGGEEAEALSNELFDLTPVYGEQADVYPAEKQTVGMAAYVVHKLYARAEARKNGTYSDDVIPPWMLDYEEEYDLPYAFSEEKRSLYKQHANKLLDKLCAPALALCAIAAAHEDEIQIRSASRYPILPNIDLPEAFIPEVDECLMGYGMTPEEAAVARALLFTTRYSDLRGALETLEKDDPVYGMSTTKVELGANGEKSLEREMSRSEIQELYQELAFRIYTRYAFDLGYEGIDASQCLISILLDASDLDEESGAHNSWLGMALMDLYIKMLAFAQRYRIPR